MTKNFEHPVEIYKGFLVTDEDNNEGYSGVEPEIDVIDNYIYINQGYGRILTNGEKYQDLIRILGYDIGQKEDDNKDEKKDYKYTIADFTESLGFKVVGKKEIKDINVVKKSTSKERYNYCACVFFKLENEEEVWVEIYPYRNQAFVEAGIEYQIMKIENIEVKHQIHANKHLYLWDKGEHSYYMVADSISSIDLFKIIDGISIEISDENVVRRCIAIRGF